jgi:hypothetical protein
MSEPRGAYEPRNEGWRSAAAALGRHSKTALASTRRVLVEQPLELATVVALAGGGLMILAEFLTLFEVKRGAIVVAEQTGGDHHSYAILVVGAACLVAALVARAGHRPPAAGVAMLGGLALAIALFGDLPDATSEGLTVGLRPAEASPAAGFWVEAAGASLALASGVAMTFMLRRAPAHGAETASRDHGAT